MNDRDRIETLAEATEALDRLGSVFASRLAELHELETVDFRVDRIREHPDVRDPDAVPETTGMARRCTCGEVVDLEAHAFTDCPNCGRTVTAEDTNRSDPTGEAGIRPNPATASLRRIDRHLRTLATTAERLTAELESLADARAEDRDHLRQLAEGQLDEADEANWCAAHLQLGEHQPAHDSYRRPRLCRGCGEVQPLLDHVPGVSRGLGATVRLLEHMATVSHAGVRSDDLEAAFDLDAGAGAKAISDHATKGATPRRLPGSVRGRSGRRGDGRAWHSIDDYRLDGEAS